MTELEKSQIRIWCINHVSFIKSAQISRGEVTPDEILAEAKKIEDWVMEKKKGMVLKLVGDKNPLDKPQ